METRPVLLIDFSALFRRAWHVATEISVAYEATVSGVNRADHMLPNALVAICCDGRGNWRKELAPSYKEHREKQPQSMFGEMDRTIDRLRKDGRLIWKFDGFEADDVIATAAMMAQSRGHTVRIATHDKDLLQLLGPSCDYLATHKWEVVGADIVRDKYGVDPEQFGDWLALVGDNSDGIKGCPGIGPKRATALLQEYKSIDAIWTTLDPPPGTEPKPFAGSPADEKSLRAHWKEVELARKLVGLRRDVPLRFEDIYETRELQPIVSEETTMEEDASELLSREDAPKEAAPSVKPEGSEDKPEQGNDGSDHEATPTDLKAAETAPAPAEDKSLTVTEPAPLVVQVEYSRQLEPRSLRDADVYARWMFNSRVYSRYPTSQSMVAAIVRGREMGYGAGASLDMFHVADFKRDGELRLILHAHAIIDFVSKSPDLEYFYLEDGSDETQATYIWKRKNVPTSQRFKYTIEDARLADLVKPTFNGKPSNWMKRPKELLRKTCGVQAGRIADPGRALGLYCFEEMGIDNE